MKGAKENKRTERRGGEGRGGEGEPKSIKSIDDIIQHYILKKHKATNTNAHTHTHEYNHARANMSDMRISPA